jgi:hypothetical protein
VIAVIKKLHSCYKKILIVVVKNRDCCYHKDDLLEEYRNRDKTDTVNTHIHDRLVCLFMFLLCLSSSCTLCTLCCQILLIVYFLLLL